MPILFDYNPDTGMKEYFDYDPVRDQVFITYEQDVSALLDRMDAIRKNPEISKKGIKEDWWYYCVIPEVVEIALMKKGLSIYKKDDLPAIYKEINTNYPYLKATEKHHS